MKKNNDKQEYTYNFLQEDSFFKVNRFLIKELGFAQALMIAYLFDEEEYLEKENKLQKDRYFYSLEKDRKKFIGLTNYRQRKTLENLQKENLIKVVRKGFPRKHYFSINHSLFYKKFFKGRNKLLKERIEEDQNLEEFNRAFLRQDIFLRLSRFLINSIGLNNAAVLSYLVSLSKYYKAGNLLQEDGSFFRTSQKRIEEIGLPIYTQRKVLKELQEKRLLLIDRRGMTQKCFFTINYEELNKIFLEQKQINPVLIEASEFESLVFESKALMSKFKYQYLKSKAQSLGFKVHIRVNYKSLLLEQNIFSKEKSISEEMPPQQTQSPKIKLNRRTPYVGKPYQEPKEKPKRKRSKLKHKEKTYPKKESHVRSISEETYCAKECKPLFDYWNSLSDVRRTPISNKTKTCPRANKFLKEILLNYNDRQIRRCMRFYNELLANEDTILNKVIPGCQVGLDEFFSFSSYTKKRIEKNNPIYNVKSWFIECMESLSVLELKYGKYREDPNPTLTNKIIKFYKNRKETKNSFSIKDINAFRLASKKFIKFFKTYKDRIHVGVHEIGKPVLCVKYLFEALEADIKEDWSLVLPTWLASDKMFDHRLINYFKKKEMLLDRKTTNIYEYVERDPIDYSIEGDHFSD